LELLPKAGLDLPVKLQKNACMDNPTSSRKKFLLYPFPVAIWELSILAIVGMGVLLNAAIFLLINFAMEKIRKGETSQMIEEPQPATLQNQQ